VLWGGTEIGYVGTFDFEMGFNLIEEADYTSYCSFFVYVI